MKKYNILLAIAIWVFALGMGFMLFRSLLHPTSEHAHARITSSEVKILHSHRHGSFPALCASFDIYLHTNKIGQSEQCGQDWNDIEKGIHKQLERLMQERQELFEQEEIPKRLERIKNDRVGSIIL